MRAEKSRSPAHARGTRRGSVYLLRDRPSITRGASLFGAEGAGRRSRDQCAPRRRAGPRAGNRIPPRRTGPRSGAALAERDERRAERARAVIMSGPRCVSGASWQASRDVAGGRPAPGPDGDGGPARGLPRPRRRARTHPLPTKSTARIGPFCRTGAQPICSHGLHEEPHDREPSAPAPICPRCGAPPPGGLSRRPARHAAASPARAEELALTQGRVEPAGSRRSRRADRRETVSSACASAWRSCPRTPPTRSRWCGAHCARLRGRLHVMAFPPARVGLAQSLAILPTFGTRWLIPAAARASPRLIPTSRST